MYNYNIRSALENRLQRRLWNSTFRKASKLDEGYSSTRSKDFVQEIKKKYLHYIPSYYCPSLHSTLDTNESSVMISKNNQLPYHKKSFKNVGIRVA